MVESCNGSESRNEVVNVAKYCEEEQLSCSDKNDTQEESESPDGGWGWLCVFSCFLSFFLFVGMSRTFGVIYNDVKDAFPESRHVELALILTLISFMTVGFAVVACALADAFTCQKVSFVGGLLGGTGLCLSFFSTNTFFMICMLVISGIGSSLSTTPGILIISKYFHKHRAKAIGIALCGAAMGSTIFPPFTRYLADVYGFRGALLIQGGLIFNTCAGALFYRELHPKKSKIKKFSNTLKMTKTDAAMRKSDSSENGLARTAQSDNLSKSNVCFKWVLKYLYVDLSLMYNPLFIIVLLSSSFVTIGYPQALGFFPPHAQSLGYSAYMGGLLLSISSIGDAMGRLISGWIFDKGFVTMETGFVICTGLLSASMIGIGLYPNFVWMSICAYIYGYFAGSIFLLIPVLLTENFGISNLPSSYGILRSLQGVASLIGSPIAGYIRDTSGSFKYSLISLGCLTLISTLVMLLLSPVKKRLGDKNLNR